MLKWLKKYWPLLALIAVWFVFECAMSWAAFCDHVNYPTNENATEENNCVFRGPAASIIRFFIHRWKRTFEKPDAYTALFTAFLALFTFTLWWSTNKLWSVTDKSLRHSEDTAQRQLRAYMSVEPKGIGTYRPSDRVIARVGFRNSGMIFAKNVSTSINCELSQDGNRTTFPDGKITGNNAIAPNSTILRSADGPILKSYINPARADAAKADAPLYLYVWGIVRYHDGFVEERFTRYCHRYNFSGLGPRTYKIPIENYRYHHHGNDAT